MSKRVKIAKTALTVSGALVLLINCARLASAQSYTYSTLFNFGDEIIQGSQPSSGLVIDSSGNLYGTTTYWGFSSQNCVNGCGVVFKITTSQTLTILHDFTGCCYTGGSDGAFPSAALTIDKSGNLYGTTAYGGLGYGTVFKITNAGTYSILHMFGKVPGDGYYPFGSLTLDSAGNLYGTTEEGGSTSLACTTEGSTGCGTIFKVTPRGTETVLYKFSGQTVGDVDGGFPLGNVLRDGGGNFYGVNLSGVLFKITPQGTASALYTFANALNNDAYIVRTNAGNFYGGFNPEGTNDVSGIWEVSNSVESNYYFCQGCTNNSPNGSTLAGPLIVSGGNLYGTTYYGGAYGEGVVYQFAPTTGIETVLYNFGDPNSFDGGAYPSGGVITDAAGNLYGTTHGGGFYGLGTVFKLTKN